MSLDQSEFETRLSLLLEQDVQATTSLTNTARELERFQKRVKVRRRRTAIVGVAAAVAVIVGGTFGAVALFRSGASHRPSQVVHHPSPSPTHTTARTPKVHALSFGPGHSLPATTHATVLKGPQNLGVAAFGAIWATTGDNFIGRTNETHFTLFRISLDGSRVLSRTSVPGSLGSNPGPVRIGDSIVVADANNLKYDVFNKTGKKIGTLPGTTTPQLTGDASGGWIATDVARLAQVDRIGLHITHQFELAGDVSVGGLATSPGLLWVGDDSGDRLLRVDAATGAITGQTKLGVVPAGVFFLHGAVYVDCGDLSLHRIDPVTMKVTAVIVGNEDSEPDLATTDNGQLWAQPAEGVITRLDPATLQPAQAIKLFGVDSEGGAFGAVLSGNRMFVPDGDKNRLYSFPLH